MFDANVPTSFRRFPDGVDLIKRMINDGADVNAKGGSLGPALTVSCASWSSTVIPSLLIKAGADVNTRGGRYWSALYAACSPLDWRREWANAESVPDSPSALILLLLDNGACVDAELLDFANHNHEMGATIVGTMLLTHAPSDLRARYA